MLREFLLVLVVSSCLAQQDGDLDSLINDIFKPQGSAGSTAAPSPPSPNLNPSNNVFLNPGNVVNPPGDKSCVTADNQPGECVQYYLCNANNAIVTDGANIIDIRSDTLKFEGETKVKRSNGFLQNILDTRKNVSSDMRFNSVRSSFTENPQNRDFPRRGEGECESYMDVCCLPPSVVDVPITPTPPTVPRGTGCGIRNPQGVGFRIKGDKDNESQFGEFPWMVAILRSVGVANTTQKLNVYQCGGALIHPQVVLTAAHCVAAKGEASAPQLKIRAGEWDTQTKNEIYGHQDRNVATIASHDQFYAGGLFNDIALLILESPVKEEDYIGTICLPPEGAYAPQGRCVASGWGKDVFGKEGRYQVILKKIELPIVDKTRCQASLRKTRLGQFFELHRSFICAGGEAGKDTCKGDGGSPLACPIPNNPDRYMQSGIVAWGIGCGENSTPGVYVNVAHLRKWIDEQLYLNNIDMTGYGDPL